MSMENKIAEEVARVAPEIYKDLLKPAAGEVGSVAGRATRALLSPLRAFLWSWEKVEALVVEGVSKRLESIPEEHRKTPDPEIAVPLIQSLSYTAYNETLREMYLNLLANSMSTAMDKSVHPSFVQIIRQMNALDAKTFEKLTSVEGYQRVINPNVALKDQGQIFISSMPEWFVGWTIDGHDIFEVSSSIVRLGKFGLIELMYDRTPKNGSYDDLEGHQDLIAILNAYRMDKPDMELELIATRSVLYVNEYGKQFKLACK